MDTIRPVNRHWNYQPGLDNGANNSVQTFKADKIVTSCGRCLDIIKKSAGEGTAPVVTGKGLKERRRKL